MEFDMTLPSFERIADVILKHVVAVRGKPLQEIPCSFCGTPFLHQIDGSLVEVVAAVKQRGQQASYVVRVTCSNCGIVISFDAATIGLHGPDPLDASPL